ncbi:MAG: hypothetical protein IJM19_07785 [Ruminococcus sp.]|nr:hypothetical protein [Ruminococcus sp.]MBR6386208.1 hypothetical protein [Ruminococcus sp.]
MEIYEKLKNIVKEKKTTAVVILGLAGLVLIMISSFDTGKNTADNKDIKPVSEEITAESYCRETEKRLEDFLENIDGAGDVKVYLSVGTGEKYVYAVEKNSKSSENQKEEDIKYVIVGGGEKSALVETVRTPEITGAVIACTGCGSPVVQERIYKAVSSALGLPTSKIFVTQMK